MTTPTCPACSAPMKLRSGSRGQFWGCSSYPTCRRTLPFVAAAPANGAPTTEDPPAGAPEPARKLELARLTYEQAKANYEALAAKLDADQKIVFGWTPADGNTRVIAAAGSGKTTTSVALIAKLIREAHCSVAQIVATTFTSKAGKELAERLNAVLPPGALELMRVGTFHGLALRGLRGAGGWSMDGCMDIARRRAGVPSSAQLWSKVLGYAGEQGVPGTGAEGLGLEEPDVKAYMLAVDVARSHGLTGEKLAAELAKVEEEEGIPYLSRAWRMVSEAKAALACWDFADALQAWYELLQHSNPTPGLVVIVDEAQDNSELQLEIARLLARAGSLILVGDGRQAIYSWRGAFPEFFLTSDKTIGAKTLELRSNYRSGSAIVAVGNKTAHGKAWNVGNAAVAKRELEGRISIAGYSDPEDEAKETAAKIRQLANDGASLSDVAILCRTNAASGAFEAALVEAEIPCVVVGGQPFFKRYEVQNCLAYVKLSIVDDMEAFARIINKPKRYLGAKFVQAVQRRLDGQGLLNAIDACIGDLYRRQRDAATELYAFLTELRSKPWPESVDMIVRLLSPVDSGAGEADADRSGIVAAVASLAKGFASAQAFLDFAARCAGDVVEAKMADGGFELPAGRVTISTIHKAKGLEWQHVVVSASAGVFPHRRSTSPARLEEEERLFYVACTRAKDSLSLTWSEVDVYDRPAGPSPFLAYAGWEGEEGSPDDEPPHGGPHGGGLPFTSTVHDEVTEVVDAAQYLEQERAAGVAMQLQREALLAAGAVPVPGVPDALEAVIEKITSAPTVSFDHETCELRQRPFAGLQGVQAAEKAPLLQSTAEELFGADAWLAAQTVAEIATKAEPKAQPGEGGRYVQPTLEDFEALLQALEFKPAPADVELKCHQKVLRRGFAAGDGMVWLSVYTTVEAGGEAARELGEDSIKVSLVYEAPDGKTKPLAKKLPYACRTRGWRVVLLQKIEGLAALLGPDRRCPRCGAPMAERKAMRPDGERTFLGCVRYPECKASRNLDGAVTARS